MLAACWYAWVPAAPYTPMHARVRRTCHRAELRVAEDGAAPEFRRRLLLCAQQLDHQFGVKRAGQHALRERANAIARLGGESVAVDVLDLLLDRYVEGFACAHY